MSREDDSWRDQALCAQTDPHVFNPGPKDSSLPAKRICQRCEVKDPCLDWALRHDESGIWGGTSAQQRQRMRRTA